MSDRTKFVKVESSDNPSREDMPEEKDEKYQPAKITDRKREGQIDAAWNINQEGATYGMGNKFDREDKITKPFGAYADPNSGDKGNYSQKNSNISRLDLVGKNYSNSGTAYNSAPIPETYKPATSNGMPDANAVEYKTVVKDRNP